MTISQVWRYLANKDAPSISYKLFNQTPRDNYPTFSVCFHGSSLYWYHRKELFDEFGIDATQYDSTIKGKDGVRYRLDYKSKLYEKETMDIQNVSSIGFEQRLFLNFSYILKKVEFVAEDPNHSSHYIGEEASAPHLFYVGYQTADTICFTRKSDDEQGLIRVNDLLTLNRSVLEDKLYLNAELEIFVHYPGQLLRAFGFPSFKSKFYEIMDWTKRIEILISEVTTLRKRPDSNVPCDTEDQKDDLKMIRQTVALIKCVPMYWKQLVQQDLELKECNLTSELQAAHHYVQSYIEILSSYDPPCVEMTIETIPVRKEMIAEADAEINIDYRSKFYQEIENSRDFGFESFWSSVGGFVGIFMGYSILQVPELISNLFTLLRSLKYTSIKT